MLYVNVFSLVTWMSSFMQMTIIVLYLQHPETMYQRGPYQIVPFILFKIVLIFVDPKFIHNK